MKFSRAQHKVIVLTLLVGVIFGSIAPVQPARAQSFQNTYNTVVTTIVQYAECRLDLTGRLAGFLDRALGDLLSFASGIWNSVKNFLNLGNILNENVPTHTKIDEPAAERDAKNCLSAAVKRHLIRAIMGDIFTFIRNDGSPRFITDYTGVITDAADRALGQVINEVTGADICEPIRPSVTILLQGLSPYSVPRLEQELDCKFTDALDQFNRFKENFADGGWDVWIKYHQSENNTLGAYLIANDHLIASVEKEIEGDKLQAESGDGFLPVRVCREASGFNLAINDTITLPVPGNIEVGSDEWQEFINTNAQAGIFINQTTGCITDEVITPARTLADQTSSALSAQRDNLIQTDDWHGIVPEVLSVFLSELLRDGFSIGPFQIQP